MIEVIFYYSFYLETPGKTEPQYSVGSASAGRRCFSSSSGFQLGSCPICSNRTFIYSQQKTSVLMQKMQKSNTIMKSSKFSLFCGSFLTCSKSHGQTTKPLVHNIIEFMFEILRFSALTRLDSVC